MAPRLSSNTLRTAAKIAMIFFGIVAVFALGRDDGGASSPIAATADEQTIDAPHQRKPAISVGSGGAAALPASLLRR